MISHEVFEFISKFDSGNSEIRTEMLRKNPTQVNMNNKQIFPVCNSY